MSNAVIELQIEALVNENRSIAICDIIKALSSYSKDLIRSIVSSLIIKNGWRVRHDRGKIFLNIDHETKSETIRHRTQDVVTIVNKTAPQNRDWVVTCVRGSNARLFFDSIYTDDEVRSAFMKLERVSFIDVRCRRYHKVKVLKTMHNF
jgi:hypothetical protein